MGSMRNYNPILSEINLRSDYENKYDNLKVDYNNLINQIDNISDKKSMYKEECKELIQKNKELKLTLLNSSNEIQELKVKMYELNENNNNILSDNNKYLNEINNLNDKINEYEIIQNNLHEKLINKENIIKDNE